MNDINITVREATREDTESIVRFQQGMAVETEGKVLDEALLRDGITEIFDSTQKGFYLVAEVNNVVVGSLLITYEWSDWRNATFWWIQSVFVDANWRRKGVYRSMHDYVVNVAKSRKDICGIRLYVERTNTIAQQTYKDLGMSHSHYDLYETDIVL
ncbi:MAG: N-acetyltransferase, GNAT superfamily (includes histone acetyltransferase HPA2) [Chloroflexi bacterium]|jgi:GNAT superfamily N-acetyltransferase|nr:MAG: N-acetyltransferase, GNAT superfamily (includes histone acetyltransferase HPA2) [Chloroflexota bacterium]